MNVKPSTFLVREKRFNTEALFIPATGVLGVRHITEQVSDHGVNSLKINKLIS
jgi:hypothetical protein